MVPKARLDEALAKAKAAADKNAEYEAEAAKRTEATKKAERAKLEATERLTLERDEAKAEAAKAATEATKAAERIKAIEEAQDAQLKAEVDALPEDRRGMVTGLPGTSAEKLAWLAANRAMLSSAAGPVPPTTGTRPATTPPGDPYKAKDASATELARALKERVDAFRKRKR